MNTKTTVTETEDQTAANRATQAETAAVGAQVAAQTVIVEAQAATADAQRKAAEETRAAAAIAAQAQATTTEVAQWTTQQIEGFHNRLGTLETEVKSLPERLSAILKPNAKPSSERPEPEKVTPEEAATKSGTAGEAEGAPQGQRQKRERSAPKRRAQGRRFI